jgi:hypothetical protein
MDSTPPKIKWMIGPVDGSFHGPFPLFAGDLLIHFRTELHGLGQPGICDLWQMSSGSQLWFAHRRELVPPGFPLHRSEVAGSTHEMEDGEVMHAPNFWRVRAGDRLVLIGERSYLETGVCYHILEFRESALVYWVREDGLMPMPEEALSASPSPDDPLRLGWARRAVAKVTSLGPPRTMAADWRIS